MEFLADYGLFLAKAVTIVIAIIIVLGALAATAIKTRGMEGGSGHIEIRNIGKQYQEYEERLKEVILGDKAKKLEQKAKKLARKKDKTVSEDKSRIYLVNFEGDIKASAVEQLRHEISAALTVARESDEVVVNIESPGGMVHTYGLAASQLKRVRDAGIPLTICVDKVAASGGYLMACVGNSIKAAPFALVGSIGVLAQIPNFNRALKRFDVDYDIMTAGEYKAPVTMWGENTEKGKAKLKEELEETHELFKSFITDHRPQVAISEVATGEVWYGQKAIDKFLVDEIMTSDDYLMKHRKDKDIYQISYVEKKSLQEKLGLSMEHGISAAILKLFSKDQEHTVTRSLS